MLLKKNFGMAIIWFTYTVLNVNQQSVQAYPANIDTVWRHVTFQEFVLAIW